MKQEICIDEKSFKEMEKGILNEVMNTSKSMLETFKFKMLFGTQVTSKQNEKTLNDLNEFRAKNWDKSINKESSYKKYLNLY
ncbi:MAG: hypothetical protein V1740_00460 [Candidatus Woesearchaeota archaeon]